LWAVNSVATASGFRAAAAGHGLALLLVVVVVGAVQMD
jgi:hypothetical protein